MPRHRLTRPLDVGTVLTAARRDAGLTQRALAERAATTQSAVSRWEHGVEEPRLSTLVRLLTACGVEADLVLRRHDEVDRAQIRQQLAMDPEARLASVTNLSRLRAEARRA